MTNELFGQFPSVIASEAWQSLGLLRGLMPLAMTNKCSPTNIVDRKLHDWTRGRSAKDARITVFYKIRNIPYAVIPELNDHERYIDILKLNKGSCTPKHFLLCYMYQKIGLEVLYAVYPFRWSDFETVYPPELQKLAEAMPLSYHLACKVNIDGNLVLVDATIDPALHKIGLPVNEKWDGLSDTLLAVNPYGEEQLYHPSEAQLMLSPTTDEQSLPFYNRLNLWLEDIRG